MSITLPIVVYGGGGIFTEYFNAIAATLGSDSFKTMWKIAVLLAGATALFSAITKRDFLTCVRWLGIYYVIFYIIFLPKISVQIIDRTDEGHAYHVDNIPLGLGALANVTTTIGDALTQLIDKVFSMPDDIRYSKTGMMMASKLAIAASQFQITDPRLSENMQSFVNQCVFYDILLNKYTVDVLFVQTDLMGFLHDHASPARAFLYNGVVTTCQQGVGNLVTDLKQNIDQIAIRYSSHLFPASQSAKDQLLKYLPLSYGYLLGISAEAASIIQQNVIANAIQDGALRFGANVNAPAALESYTFTRAQEQQRLTQTTLGDSAAYWLPIMKNAFESIMYGCFVFIVLLAVFPFGPMILKNYVYTLFWIQMWAPLYAVIHMICSYYAKVHSMAISSAGITLQSLSGFIQVNQDMAGLAGYLTLSVPFLAAGLVKGMATTMTQLAQYIGGVSQSAGVAAAAEASTGNIGLGNTHFSTHSAFNTSANHFDTAGHVSSGLSYQLSGGEGVTLMPDGTAVMDRRAVMSNLGVEVHLADSIRNAATQQAEKSYNAALSDSQAYGQSQSAAMRGLYELANHTGTSRSSGESWAYSESSSTQEAFRDVREITQKFANEHHISYGEAANVLSRAYIEGKGGAGGGTFGLKFDGVAGGGREAQHRQQTETSSMYSNAQDFIRNTNYANDVETALRATRDQSLHVTNDEGRRLVQNVGASFDQANTWRREAANNFQSAEGYRNIATQAQENSVSVDVNANQAFYEYLSSQPGTNGKGHMGANGAAVILRDPELAQHYANGFASQYIHSQLSNWSGDMPHSAQGVQSIYQTNNQHISSPASVKENNLQNQIQIAAMSSAASLGEKDFINTNVQSQVENKIKHDAGKTQNANSYLSAVGSSQEEKVKGEEVRERHGGFVRDMAHGIDTEEH